MSTENIHIVGGGIIGLCTAWYLKKEGCEVTIIDRNDFSDGTSYGNAGMIVPSHFVPMATPGVITQGLKWLLNSKSPFYIKPRLNLDLMQWLWHFYRSANEQQVEKAMPVLYELNERSKELYKVMAAENGFDFGFEERGLLMLYKTRKQAEEEEELAEKAHQLGIQADLLDYNGLKRLEPEMDMDVLGGIYFPGDAHLYPNLLMKQLVTQLKNLGVQFISNSSITDFDVKGSKVTTLKTDSGSTIPVENVLLSSGSWTGLLLKKAGEKIHLQDGKGYSVTLRDTNNRPRIPTILSEAKVAITPMGNDLRIGGTLELSGLSQKVSQMRVQGIIESIPAYYKNLDVSIADETPIWKGYRPCTPDGMPYIGKSDALTNCYVGTGHGMMGLSLGAVTGKLISELITGQKPMMDLHLFRLNRF
ncbi:MAG: FAD-dependent oxidoreductase [Chitinophagales bacterium]|nr:FAD-dependent oxidoreductase [Chitinophagales bacterium]